jgi:hypothetical protein
MEEVDYMYDTLIDMGLFTEDELSLVTSINGYSIDTLNDCLYVRYGYRSLEQYLESEGLQ